MMQLTNTPTTVVPALANFSTPVLSHESPRPMPVNDFLDTDSQIQQLQMQLQQLQKIQHQQQSLRQNPPAPYVGQPLSFARTHPFSRYKFGVDSVPQATASLTTTSTTTTTPSTPLSIPRQSPSSASLMLPPLTPNSMIAPLTPNLQPLTPQPYMSPGMSGLMMSGPPVSIGGLSLPTGAPTTLLPPSSPTLEQLAVHYNVRLDASSDNQVALDADTRDFIANALNVNIPVPEYKLPQSLSELYQSSSSNNDFDAESLFVQQFQTDPATDEGGSSDEEAMVTEGTQKKTLK